MAIQPQDLRNLVVGTLKLVEPTEKRDSSKRVIWKAQCCICGEFVHGAKPDLEKYAGYTKCLGHPPKGLPAMPVEGFKLHPDMKGTLEQAEAAAAWELKRNPVQPEEKRQAETSQVASEPKKAATHKDTLPKPSEVLQKRLGLSGYTTTSISLNVPVTILGCTTEKVVFAKQIAGADLVLLHVQLINAAGKRLICSSRKKVPADEWSVLAEQLSAMKINFREKESKRVTK